MQSNNGLLLQRALKIFKTHYGPDHYQVAMVLGNLSIAYGTLGDVQQKQILLERALEIQEAHYGKNHYAIANNLMNLGNAYGALGEVHRQRDLYERALKIEEAHYGLNHIKIANTLANLGTAYGDLGDAHQQRALCERALKIKEAHYGPEHSELVAALISLTIAYTKLKQRSLALKAARRTYYILTSDPQYGIRNSKTQQVICLFQLSCGFTLTDLQSASVDAENGERKEQTLPAEHKVPKGSVAVTFSLYQKAELCLAQGKINEVIYIYESALSRAEDLNVLLLHNLACAYHIRSRQKQNHE